MGRWDSIMDASNPFNTTGLSDEVEAMLDYMVAAKADTGVNIVATSTTDHPKYSASGNLSRHRAPGTNGEGLGLDMRMRTRGNDIHSAAFRIWLPVALRCHELIYAAVPKNVKNEAWVLPYAKSDHHDHVHISVDKGVILRYTPTQQPGRKVPKGMLIFVGDHAFIREGGVISHIETTAGLDSADNVLPIIRLERADFDKMLRACGQTWDSLFLKP